MILLLRIAWRSFLRHRRRSLITVAAVSLGLVVLLVTIGLGNAAHTKMADVGVRMGAGHVVVQKRGYQEEQTIDFVVEDPEAVLSAAKSVDGVVAAVPRVRTEGLLVAGDSSSAIALVGVDPHAEAQVSLIASDKSRVEGAYLRSKDELDFVNHPPDIYIGTELARRLELELEDRVVVTVSPQGGGRPASAAFRVRGIFRTGIDEIDSFYAEIPIEAAANLLQLDGAVTQVAVLLDRLSDTARATQTLQARLGDHDDLEILPWQEVMRELYDAILLDDLGNYFMVAIIFVIVAIGIFNTITMSVVERTREFGVMLALGTSSGRLFGIVMAEALVLAVVSAVVGLALGLGLHAHLAYNGLDLSVLYSGDIEIGGVVLEGRVYSELAAATVLRWLVVIMGIVLAAALYPAVRAARLDPIEAMKHV